MKHVESFRVWVRSLGYACRVCVEGVENARWLVDRLAQTPAMDGLDFVDLQPVGSMCTFQVSNSSERTLTTLEAVLPTIPGVTLMLEPESIR